MLKRRRARFASRTPCLTGNRPATAGLHLSIEDLFKWDENFYQPRVGGPKLIEQLTQQGALDNGEKITYARGLFIDEYRGVPRVHHAGNWIGYNAMLARFPKQHTSVAILCNFEGAEASELSEKVADIVPGRRSEVSSGCEGGGRRLRLNRLHINVCSAATSHANVRNHPECDRARRRVDSEDRPHAIAAQRHGADEFRSAGLSGEGRLRAEGKESGA